MRKSLFGHGLVAYITLITTMFHCGVLVNEAVELCVFLRNNILANFLNDIYNKVIKLVTNYWLYDVQICITTTELSESKQCYFARY